MNYKYNNGYNRTHINIFGTILALSENENFNGVTVKTICEICGINRSTFYAHFIDLDDCMNQLCDSYEASVFDDMAGKSFEKIAEAYLKYIKENKGFYKSFLKDGANGEAAKHLYLVALADEKELYKSLKSDSSSAKYIYSFYKNGIITVIKDWVDAGCRDSVKSIVEIIEGLIPEYACELIAELV